MRHAGFTSATVLLLALAAREAGAADVTFSGGFPVTKKAQIYPLAKIKRGDKGVGYTVLAEDKVTPFQFEVLGVLENMLGPGRDVILSRLSGPEIEFTGVIAGMSGSPVFIDGKLVGAVSYRFGQFAKEPIAGITPIESMIAAYETEAHDRPSQAASVLLPSGNQGTRLVPDGSQGRPRGIRVADFRERNGLPAAKLPKAASIVGPDDAHMIETPIVLAGLEPSVFEDLSAQLEHAGFVTMAAGSGGASRTLAVKRGHPRGVEQNKAAVAGRVRAAPIAPAAPIAAVLMRGDIVIAATGTVTLVEDGEVLAFGHPFLGYGSVAFPMATTAILNTLASPLGSYKMGAAALEVGSITHDRITAIAGRLGAATPMIPMRVHVSGYDRVKGTAETEANVEAVDDPTWLPTLAGSAIANATVGRLNFEAGGTVEFEATIEVGNRALTIGDTYSAPAPTPVGFFAARDVANTIALITNNNLAEAEIKSVDVKMKLKREVVISTLEQVVPDRTVVFPGEKLELTARVRPYLRDPKVIRLSVEIPRDMRGDVEIFVGGGIEMDRREGDVFGERYPEDLDALLGILSERRAAKAIFAAAIAQRPGLRSSSEVLTSLPPSMRATLSGEPGRLSKAMTEVIGKVSEVPYSEVVMGSVSVPVTVVRDGSGS